MCENIPTNAVNGSISLSLLFAFSLFSSCREHLDVGCVFFFYCHTYISPNDVICLLLTYTTASTHHHHLDGNRYSDPSI